MDMGTKLTILAWMLAIVFMYQFTVWCWTDQYKKKKYAELREEAQLQIDRIRYAGEPKFQQGAVTKITKVFVNGQEFKQERECECAPMAGPVIMRPIQPSAALIAKLKQLKKETAMPKPQFRITDRGVKFKKDRFFVTMIAGNGKKINVGFGYNTKRGAQAAIALVKRITPIAETKFVQKKARHKIEVI